MSNTALTGDQILQAIYNTNANNINTAVTANISGAQEVVIRSSDDNIAIRNTGNTNELLINADGSINVVSAGSSPNVNIHDSAGNNLNSTGNALNINAATLPLPSGAATSALQTTGNISLSSIDSKLTNPLPVSASSLPLPSGASTSALQTTGNTSLASIDSKLTNPLPISGTVTANIGTSGSLALDASVKLVQGTVTAGTVASKSSLGGGQYNSTLPTLTNTQQAAIQLDSQARQIIVNTPSNGVLTDNSFHAGSPGVFATVFAANANRKYLLIQNIDTNGGYIVVDFGASPNLLKGVILGPLGSLVMESGFVSTEQVSIAGISTTTDYCAKQG